MRRKRCARSSLNERGIGFSPGCVCVVARSDICEKGGQETKWRFHSEMCQMGTRMQRISRFSFEDPKSMREGLIHKAGRMATAINVCVQEMADRRAPGQASRQRTREISPEAGRALEVLGHAIEYLTDEYVHETTKLSTTDPEVAAILLLMDLNRKVYFECPIVPTIGERVRAFLRGGRALMIDK